MESTIAGTVVKITVTDLLILRELTVEPRPRFNLILGANGSGKSSIFAAIVLGLGGSPSMIGRTPEITSFIRHGCRRAVIELELFNPSGLNYVIERTIDDRGNSKWCLGGRNVTFNTVNEFIRSLNIQVDNLCQFLAQDRVQDFSSMNSMNLLVNTQKCIGDRKLVSSFEELLEVREEIKELSEKVNRMTLEKDEQQTRLEGLAEYVNRFKERRGVMKSINGMKRKVIWLQYEEKLQEIEQAKEKKKKLQEALQTRDDELKTLRSQTNERNSMARKVSTQRNQHRETARALQGEIRKRIRDFRILKLRAKEVDQELLSKKYSAQNNLKLIEEKKKEISTLQSQVDSTSEPSIREEIKQFDIKITSFLDALEDLRVNESHRKREIAGLNSDLRMVERSIEKAGTVMTKKEAILRSHSDVFKAYSFLKENRSLFKGPSYGPIFVEINVRDPSFAKYVEHLVPMRDLIAFVFEYPEDVSLFIKKARSLNVKVNAVCSMPLSGPLGEVYKPLMDIQSLRFQSYLVDNIEAPSSVLNYLCKSFHVHNVPVGDSKTIDYLDQIPSRIRVFFAGDLVVRCIVSSYTKESLKTTSSVTNANYLAFSSNSQELSELQDRKSKIEHEMGKIREKRSTLSSQISNAELELNKLRTQRKEKAQTIERMKLSAVMLRSKIESLKELEKTARYDPKEDEKQVIKKVEALRAKAVKEISTVLDKIGELLENQKEECRKRLVHEICVGGGKEQEEQLRVLEESLAGEKEELHRLELEYSTLKASGLAVYKEAKDASDGLTPDSAEFRKRFPEFHRLSDEIQTLEENINTAEARARLLKTADEEIIMKEYETVKRRLHNVNRELETTINRLNALVEKKDSLKEFWVPEITKLVYLVSARFKEFFEAMGCNGEVELHKGQNEEEFENYGINIKVAFRQGAELQQLDNKIQSGGERTLTIAVYLLCMQCIAKVPLVCIDEINQGMDAVNEMRVYTLLLRTVASVNSAAQFFLITPKLLPNVPFSKDTAIICVAKLPKKRGKHSNFLDYSRRYTNRE